MFYLVAGVYHKINRSKFIILVLYVDDILLASSYMDILCETKAFLSSKFDMKDFDKASYILGIKIHRDHARNVIGLSQRGYIDKV